MSGPSANGSSSYPDRRGRRPAGPLLPAPAAAQTATAPELVALGRSGCAGSAGPAPRSPSALALSRATAARVLQRHGPESAPRPRARRARPAATSTTRPGGPGAPGHQETRAHRPDRPSHHGRSAEPGSVASAGSTSTWPSMTPPGWPTSRSCPMSRASPSPRFSGGHWPRTAALGIRVRRILTDNGSGYRSHVFASVRRKCPAPASPDPALYPPDQRQGRALHPDAAAGMGLHPARTRPRPTAWPPCRTGSTTTMSNVDHAGLHGSSAHQPPGGGE